MLNADLAHLVERDLAKVEVAGSSPVIRSIFSNPRNSGEFKAKESVLHDLQKLKAYLCI